MPVHNIQSEQAFHKTISDNDFVIANFFATQDEGCKTLAPIFVEQANREDHQRIFFGKVDVHELVDLSKTLGVTKTPTFVAYKDGSRAGQIVEPGTQALLQFIGELA
ncbi:hypothetical protein E4U57_006088 [Claviceps arundinis]|uniref:Thioredoxin domain-containing protein n=1 Tax=Claviceps arundinis TaxID=1623583 RepID=A0A9P7SQX0_9HYPO|nr:hypothetical protein E4U57_006088 [Claviceps arundinis]KAG5974726.1 hypothetical protein E4U56_004280 [Claviceps arundinis]